MDLPPSGTLTGKDGLGAGPLLALLLFGLLADVAPPEEAYAGIDYGLSLLAFLGSTGGVLCLTSRLHARLDPLPWASPITPAARTFTSDAGPSAGGEGWPLLVALLFGLLVVVISGLGGWV